MVRKEVRDVTGQNEVGGPIDHSVEWTDAIYSCLGGIVNALSQGTAPTKETAETVHMLADAAARLTFG